MTPARARTEAARHRGASFPPDAWERMRAVRDTLDHIDWLRENSLLTLADVREGMGIKHATGGWPRLAHQLTRELIEARRGLRQ